MQQTTQQRLSQLILEGDRVMASRDFLKSTGQLTGEVPFWKGTVLSFTFCGAMRIAHIQWDGQPGLSSWLVNNLV